MKAGWWVAVATGMALGAAPIDAFAQSASQRARAEQQAEQRRQAEQQRAEQRRQAEQRQAEQRRMLERERAASQSRAPVRGIIVDRSRTAPRNDRRDDRDRYNDRDRYDTRATHTNPQYGVMRPQPTRGNARGPSFCRSGAGHPVFGTRWCRDKGFNLGNDRYDRYDRYDDRDYDIWRDIVLRQPRDRRYDRALNRAMLQEVLGAVMLNEFEVYARQYGNAQMTGLWLDGRGSVLQLQLGSMPIARLTDSDRDGRVDSVQLRR